MRKIRIAFAVMMSICCLTVKAQYEPNTKWPYIYEDFIQGTIYFADNKKSSAEMNIHLWGNVLHYVSKNGKIYQSEDNNIVRVEIGDDAYIYSAHKLMMIVSSKENNLLLKEIYGDFDSMFSGTGAYGASLNSSSSKDLSSLELGGLDMPELGKMLQDKNAGKVIPLKEKYYFVIDGIQVDANKKSVETFIGNERKDEWKSFLKEKKIKWKNEDSLIEILHFIFNR